MCLSSSDNWISFSTKLDCQMEFISHYIISGQTIIFWVGCLTTVIFHSNHNFFCCLHGNYINLLPLATMVCFYGYSFYGYVLVAHSNKILFIQMVTSVSLVVVNFSICIYRSYLACNGVRSVVTV